MRKNVICLTLCAMLLALYPSAEAQQPKKVTRIGYLSSGDAASESTRFEAIRRALREIGYIEGQNITIESRYAEGKRDRYHELAADLVHLKVDIIVVAGGASWVRAAKNATKTIPIVMVGGGVDPVKAGLVESLARPGGNVTGLTTLSRELGGKRLELLKESIPKLSRVAVLWNAANPYKETDLKAVQPVADALKVAVHSFRVREPNGFDDAFKAATKVRAEGLLTLDDPFTIAHRTRITDLALSYKLPAVYSVRPFVDAGGLMYYGPDRVDQNRRAAAVVDKVLKGSRPGDLPVERPTAFELVVNLKTAKALDITIPQSLLARADEVIR